MTYLLDTNTCIRYLNDRNSPAAHKLLSKTPSDIRLCSVVKLELYFGAYKSQRRAVNLTTLAKLFNQFISLPFDDLAADVAGREQAQLATLGTPIGPNDLLIASIALANNLTLVTHNTREFSRVAGLLIEDWEV